VSAATSTSTTRASSAGKCTWRPPACCSRPRSSTAPTHRKPTSAPSYRGLVSGAELASCSVTELGTQRLTLRPRLPPAQAGGRRPARASAGSGSLLLPHLHLPLDRSDRRDAVAVPAAHARIHPAEHRVSQDVDSVARPQRIAMADVPWGAVQQEVISDETAGRTTHR